MVELPGVEWGEVVADDARIGAGGIPAEFASRGREVDADGALIQRIRLPLNPSAFDQAIDEARQGSATEDDSIGQVAVAAGGGRVQVDQDVEL